MEERGGRVDGLHLIASRSRATLTLNKFDLKIKNNKKGLTQHMYFAYTHVSTFTTQYHYARPSIYFG